MNIALAWIDWSDPTDRSVAENLARELAQRGYGVVCVGPKRNARDRFSAVHRGLRIYRVSSARELLSVHRRERIDVWHCHVFARDHRVFAQAVRRWRWPMVATLHLVLRDYLPFVGGKSALAELLGVCDAITTVSCASREEFLGILPRFRGKTTVVYNGVRALPVARRRLPRRPFIFCAARLAPYKGQDLLLMAFARLREQYPHLRLVLAGRDQTRGGIRELAQTLGISKHVRLAGMLSPAEIGLMMRRCQFFILPSRRENFPLVLLEAMQAGKPIVATKTGGVGEMIAHGREGFLVPPGNVEALGEAMAAFAGDPALRRTLGQNARRKSYMFSWARAAEAFSAIYRKTVHHG